MTTKLYILFVLLFIGINAYTQTGKIEGRIFDAKNNEPLPFVTVVLNGTNIGTATDMDGRFRITGLNPGIVKITASFVGYVSKESDQLIVSTNKSAYIEIALEQTDKLIDAIIVNAKAFQRTQESPVSLRSIGVSEIEFNPGSNRDISKVIQSFPGVGSSVSFRNDVIVRGGGPSESRFYLDGVEIPNLNHFSTQGASGGPVGIINADFVRNVNYYSGAFPVNRGNALSGIFEFTQIDGNKEKTKYTGVIGASELSLTMDGPLGKKTSYVLSARQSYLQFLFSALGLPFLPTFNDFQFKSRTQFNKKNELIIVGLGAIDRFTLNTGIKEPDETQRYILNFIPYQNQWNYAVGAVYKHYFKNGYQTWVLSRNMLNNRSYKYQNNIELDSLKTLDYTSQEMENKFRFENNFRFSDFRFIFGLGGEYDRYTTDTYQKIFRFGKADVIQYDSNLDLFKWNAFASLSRGLFSNRVQVSLGTRVDANNYSKNMNHLFKQFSPRMSISYILNNKWSLSANTGQYFQLPAYTTLGFRNNEGKLVNRENDLSYIKTIHYIAGTEYNYSNEIQFTLEGFYKKYTHYPFSQNDSISLANQGADFGVVGNEEVVSTNQGRAVGAEFQARFNFTSNLFINLSYTYVRSEFENRSGDLIPSSWDSKHLLVFTSGKEFKKNWRIGTKWRFVGGLPYTPYDLENSAYILAWNAGGSASLDYSRLNSERFEAYHQLDVRIDKRFYFKKWSLTLYLDIQNLYNQKSKEQDIVLQKLDPTTGQPIIIDPSLPIENQKYDLYSLNSENGTVLPTIGLIVKF